MKKSAIVLAVASALAASASVHAETTFYGRISSALVRVDPEQGDANWDVIASGSRWGVRASEDLGNGISANARLETAIPSGEYNGNADATGRLAWAGLSGGFGEIKIGTMWGPYYDALGAADIFNEANWYSLYNGGFRVNNAIRYDSPDLGGFTLAALARVDGDESEVAGTSNDQVDEYQLNGRFNLGPFYIGAAYRKNENNEDQQYGLSTSFDFAGASLAAMYEHVDPDGSGNDSDAFYITAQYKIANNTLKAGYGLISDDFNDLTDIGEDRDDDRHEWAVGVQHSMSSSSRVWVEYQDEEDNGSFLSLGLRKDW